MKAFSSIFSRLEAADCELCEVWFGFAFFQNTSLKVTAIHESKSDTSHLFIDLILQTSIEGLTGLLWLQLYIIIHTWN